MEKFCRRRHEELAALPLAAAVVCGDTARMPRAGEGGGKNLEKLTRLLPGEPSVAAILGGRMRMDELDGRDRHAIEVFYRRLGRRATGFDRMDPGAASAFAAEVKKKLMHRNGGSAC